MPRRPGLPPFLLVLGLLAAAPACAQPSGPAPTARPAAAAAGAPALDSTGVAWHPSVEAALAAAQQSGKKVMVFVYAPWCGWCRKTNREVFPDPAVRVAAAMHFEAVRVDGEDTTGVVRYRSAEVTPAQFAAALGTTGYPTTAFMTKEGDLLTKLPGFAPADEYGRILRYLGTDAYTSQPYDAFKAAEVGTPTPGPRRQ